MFGSSFYFSITRKYVIAFGTLFNDIVIQRLDSTGTATQTMKIPLTYAPKDKMLARIIADPTLTKETALSLPRMSFELSNLAYDGSRKKNTLNLTVRKDLTNPNKLKYQYQSVPYDLNFRLYIYVKNAEDGTKILEQILPYFKPQWDMTLNIIPEFNIKIDTPVELRSVSSEDKYDGQFTERRSIIWTLDFVVRGEYFGPIKSKPIIKFPRAEFYIEPNDQDMVGYYKVSPGLTANGTPTSSAIDSVDPNIIEVDDDFGFVEESSGLVLNE